MTLQARNDHAAASGTAAAKDLLREPMPGAISSWCVWWMGQPAADAGLLWRADKFIWPLNGRVIIEGFGGSVGNGERNDGINIAAKEGAPIHAAATAAPSPMPATNLKGYGNLDPDPAR